MPWPAIALAAAAAIVAVGAMLATARGEPVIGVQGAAALDAGSVGQGGTWSSDPASPATMLLVDVGGAVARPGVYRLPPGARVGDAIAAAGGYGAAVDARLVDRQLNLAATVRDGEKIRVPMRGDVVASSGDPGGGTPGAAGPIDLNAATADVLDTLPGIGPATAAKIIAAREEQRFASIDDLLARKVVGAATLEKLRPLVVVGP